MKTLTSIPTWTRCVSLALLLLGATPTVFGQGIIYVTPPTPIWFGSDTGFGHSTDIDLTGSGNVDFIFKCTVGAVSLSFVTGCAVVSDGKGFVAAMSEGDIVSSSLDSQYQWWIGDIYGLGPAIGNQYPSPGNPNGNFAGKDAFIGLMFQINGETHYGWMEICNPYNVTDGSVLRWAYESEPNTPIMVGQIPEPETWTLLGMSGLALMMIQRRKGNHLIK